ncbi:molybdopterin molybdotransferase MoeA [Sulfurisphaera ohwakuensis]|uniref:Molybdopterin molybdenumtransferase MoeA n=1 Tax=Sulfurisphaera ohwakuensis TaxID=69656 RepID=A0A650CIJ0_SULOH|nr:molybdopterin molybdotransferase MoeA [Sulfurisphaera ohwakuensis]MBB5253360.1 molybdopterin molybdotransferase [Sulfurisphaera ohwakuensis]QGR17681.1 molybdopterin molybdenumtransferase MoeA [Sulfurisphaera ohwakuensis]
MLISLEEARKIIDINISSKYNYYRYESIYNSVGKIILEDIYAIKSIPEVNLSAMDGFAFKVSDYKKHGKLKIVGKLFPSSKEIPELKEGEAYYVATGAPIPKGADAVVRIEASKVINNELIVGEEVFEGKDIKYAGEDVKEGELIVKKGDVLTPYHLGILTYQGIRKVKIGNIKSCVIASGDEISPFNDPLPELIPDSISPIILSILEKIGKATYYGVVRDEKESIKQKLIEMKESCDIIFFIGGSSVGEKDYVKKLVAELGKLLFEGVSVNIIKRGGVGLLEETPIVSLPGQVVSAVTVFHEHGLHIISRMLDSEIRKFVKVKLGKDMYVEHKMDSTYLFRIENGEAFPLRWGTGLYSELIKADGFGYLSRGKIHKRGEEIEIQKFL